ncbi:MAG TPA: hypothetical protein PL033_03470 [Candidatus Brocadiia bacterium]|nr:hypothetical protein [Candidatus Brocadiia bacterium]
MNRTLARLMTVACLALSVAMAARAAYGTFDDAELMIPEFGIIAFGPGILTRTDVIGDGVLFEFAGLDASASGVKDDYPVSDVGQILPSHGNGDFSNLDGVGAFFTNIGDDTVGVSVFVNTGFTGPSGTPSGDLANDTFWRSEWIDVPPSETRLIALDFGWATPWGIADNPLPHTQGLDGVAAAINAFDISEVSAIGFQVRDLAGVADSSRVLVKAVPEPSAAILIIIAAPLLLARRTRRKA